MSASQTLHLIEKLTEADIPKETATELLEFVEKKQTNLVTEDYLEARMAATDAKIDKLDMKIGKLDAKTGELDAKIGELDAKIGKLDVKTGKLSARITGLMLFLGFNTSLLVALIILVLRTSFG